jgi:hypothetical protein
VDISEDRFGEYEKYSFTIEDLNIGDVLEVDYAYSVMYSENVFSLMTFRVFFHDDFPILKKDFVFTREKGLDTEINSFFCEHQEEFGERYNFYYLHLEDLDPFKHESGSRPYLALPHMIISIRPDEMVYTIPYTYVEAYIPFYVFGVSTREKRHLTIARAMVEGVNSKQYNQIRKFIRERTERIAPDETGYNKLYHVHNYIADNFEFDEDIEYYDRLDVRDERMGDYTSRGVIRDRSRYNLYVALIFGIDMNYFTAYLADKRTGAISQDYFEPTITNDNLFAILLNNETIQFLYPKKERFGYYLNELPFYFEDVPVRLIHLNDYRDYKSAIEARFRSVNTPPSNSNDNFRSQSTLVNVNLDDETVDFEVNISLAGQFSTLGRSAYIYGSYDKTVNRRYSTKFWEAISPDIVPYKFEKKSVSSDFPFKANFTASFRTRKCITEKNDTIYLDLGGWFNHIVDKDLNAANRMLDYYPDFKYSDTYNYQVKFNKKVKVIDKLPILQINNDYGQLVMKCIQMLDGSIILYSKVTVTTQMVAAKDISFVEEIQAQIRDLNAKVVRLVYE